MSTRKQRGERKYSNARDRAEKKARGAEQATLDIPKGVELFKIDKEGVYRFDILPYEVGEGNPYADPGMLHYERTYHMHRGGDGVPGQICLQQTYDEPCPICKYAAKLNKDPDSDPDEIKALRAKERQLFWVFDRRDGKIKLWDVSYHLFGERLDKKIKMSDSEDGYENFFHLGQEGMTLRVAFSEEKFGKMSWFDATDIELHPRKKPLSEKMLNAVSCLDDIVKHPSYDDVNAAFFGGSEETDTPAKKKAPAKKATRGKAPAKPAEEEDASWEDGDGEEDGEGWEEGAEAESWEDDGSGETDTDGEGWEDDGTGQEEDDGAWDAVEADGEEEAGEEDGDWGDADEAGWEDDGSEEADTGEDAGWDDDGEGWEEEEEAPPPPKKAPAKKAPAKKAPAKKAPVKKRPRKR